MEYIELDVNANRLASDKHRYVPKFLTPTIQLPVLKWECCPNYYKPKIPFLSSISLRSPIHRVGGRIGKWKRNAAPKASKVIVKCNCIAALEPCSENVIQAALRIHVKAH